MNRKDAATKREAQRNYYLLINTSSTKVKIDGKSNYGLDRLQKRLRYGPPKLDTTLSQNVENTRPNRTVFEKDHANRECAIDSRRTNFT